LEELKSTEVLDREILEDARKKALRLLSNSEDTIKTQNEKWENKLKEAILFLDNKHCEHLKTEALVIMARLPIDKLRVKTEKTEELLQSAVQIWYKNLNRRQILSILSNDLITKINVCKEQIKNSKEQVLLFFGISKTEIETIIKHIDFPFSPYFKEQLLSDTHLYPQIILETENIRIISSIKDIIDFILNEYREELTEALVGSDFMESL